MIAKIKYILKQRSPWILKLVTFLCLFYGQYLKISESKIICGFLRVYCIFISSVIIWGFYISYTKNVIYYGFAIIEYVFTIVIYFILYNDSIFKFYNNLEIYDRIMGFKEIPHFACYMIMFLIVNAIFRPITGFFRSTYIFSTWIQRISVGGALCIIEMNMFGIAHFFSLFHQRMQLMRKFLESNSVPVNITGMDEVAVSVRNVKKSLYYYDKLLDCLQSLDIQVQIMVIVFIIFVF
ncbi:hypothetical protein B5X24_HaOG200962 [Helicoverpa armigera]|nr:hypothetical protein B5X24_HaOG200962 [Helicoverpa armigera]